VAGFSATKGPDRATRDGWRGAAGYASEDSLRHAGSQVDDQRSFGAKYVYDFAEGSKDMKDLLGGKGANLAEMSNLGLPVPPGFTITTEACRAYLESGTEPAELADEVAAHLNGLEQKMGKQLGQPDDPLLVSVRSGAKFSMPGMMETVLNIGLTDESVLGLAKQAGDDRFAWDSYRRPAADVRPDRARDRR
jgi:pyruvate,orthophosphate dikinase